MKLHKFFNVYVVKDINCKTNNFKKNIKMDKKITKAQYLKAKSIVDIYESQNIEGEGDVNVFIDDVGLCIYVSLPCEDEYDVTFNCEFEITDYIRMILTQEHYLSYSSDVSSEFYVQLDDLERANAWLHGDNNCWRRK